MALTKVKNKYEVDSAQLKADEEKLVNKLQKENDQLKEEAKIFENSFKEDLKNKCLFFYEYFNIEDPKQFKDAIRDAGVVYRGNMSEKNLLKLLHEKIFTTE